MNNKTNTGSDTTKPSFSKFGLPVPSYTPPMPPVITPKRVPEKKLNAIQLNEIMGKLLVGDEIDDMELFEKFVTDVANLVCDYCGGEVTTPAEYTGSSINAENYVVGISANDNLPSGGGIFAPYDTDVPFPEDVE